MGWAMFSGCGRQPPSLAGDRSPCIVRCSASSSHSASGASKALPPQTEIERDDRARPFRWQVGAYQARAKPGDGRHSVVRSPRQLSTNQRRTASSVRIVTSGILISGVVARVCSKRVRNSPSCHARRRRALREQRFCFAEARLDRDIHECRSCPAKSSALLGNT